jgi:peptidoglycan/LPS O-acetylase OafA/YrhL
MERIAAIEYLRALCVLYIVGFWHLFDYTSAFSDTLLSLIPITERITYTTLALFVFISGYLLGGKKNKALSTSLFLKKRLLRIIPLYFLAIFLFYLFSIDHSSTLLKALLGISMFYGPAPQTLWFICMLLFFYAITPFLLKIVDAPIKFFATTFTFFLIIIASKACFNGIDPRQILYFPAFILGLYCANFGFSRKPTIQTAAYASLIIGLAISTIQFSSSALTTLKFIPFVTAASYLVFSLCEKYGRHFKNNTTICILSYASFSMYLFHRPIFIAMQKLYYPSNPIWQALYLAGPCLLIIIATAWSIQKIYDNILNSKKVFAYPAAQKRGSPAEQLD